MRCNTFGRSLLFAALAASGLFALEVLLVPPLRLATLVGGYAVGVAAAYVAAIAPRRAPALGAGSLALLLGAVLLMLPLSAAQTAVGAALVVSVCRSALLYRARPLRSLLLELALLAGGLGLARTLGAGGTASPAFGLWGYLLVQSLFFLAGGVTARSGGEAPADPFERARARLLALLDAP
ncbi:MAG TPA: hypothetical protein VIY27_13195 [Myxococcota bacterium]